MLFPCCVCAPRPVGVLLVARFLSVLFSRSGGSLSGSAREKILVGTFLTQEGGSHCRQWKLLSFLKRLVHARYLTRVFWTFLPVYNMKASPLILVGGIRPITPDGRFAFSDLEDRAQKETPIPTDMPRKKALFIVKSINATIERL